MSEALVTSNMSIFQNGALWTQLGWSASEVSDVINLINASDTLRNELLDLSSDGSNWNIFSTNDGGGHTDDNAWFDPRQSDPRPNIEIDASATIYGSSYSDYQVFVSLLAYEVGHAEDPQYNSINYDVSKYDLAAGANVALLMLSEGKSEINQTTVVQQIAASGVGTIPTTFQTIDASTPTQEVFDVAGAAVLNHVDSNPNEQLFASYLGNQISAMTASAPQQLTADLNLIVNSSASRAATFLQNADSSINMTVPLTSAGSVTSYTVVFGGYGSVGVAAAGTGGENQIETTNPSPSNETTYQEFTFTDGHEDYFFASAAGGTVTIIGSTSTDDSGTSSESTYGVTIETGYLLSTKYGTFAMPTAFSNGLMTAYTSADSTIQITASNELLYAAGNDEVFSIGSDNITNVTLLDATSSGGTLDISGTSPGAIFLNETVNSYGSHEDLITFGSGTAATTLTTSNISTIVGSNGLTALNLSLEDKSSKGNSYDFSNDGHGGFIVTDSDGLSIDVQGGIDTVILGNGNDTVTSDVYDLTIDFGDGANDTLLHAGEGSVVQSGLGSDTFNISNDVLITGATPQDRITYNGSDVYGALAWNSAQGGWATNNLTGVSYGLNQQGDLVIKVPGSGGTDEYMYIANYVGGPGVSSNEDTADIFVGVASETAYRLLGPHPNVNFVWSQFNLANAEYKVNTGKNYWPGADPLVLDLTGEGLDLIGESETSPMYDLWGDGFAVHTGWVKPDDGLLVWDDNGVDQLLGAGDTSGFAALAAAAGINLDDLTSNGGTESGIIDSSNTVFSQLYVWQDLNGNGVMDPGELESLSQLDIASISVNATAQSGDVVAGNTVTETSSFTYTDGTTGEIADVSFITDNFHTQYTGDTTVSSAAATEPNLKGYGTLTDLQVAMTLDPSLISTVNTALASMDVVDLDTLRNDAMTIFSAWAAAVPLTNTELAPGGHSDINILITSEDGIPEVTDYAYQVTSTDPTTGENVTYWALASGTPVLDSDGNVIQYPTLAEVMANPATGSSWATITGAELNFVERYGGNPLDISLNPSAADGSLAVLGPVLTAAWNALNLETVRLAMQGPLASYFAGLSYDATTDTFDVTTDEQLAPMFTAIFAAAPTDAAGATAWINSWAPILNVIEGDLAPSQGLTATYGYLFASMVAGYEASSLPIDIKDVAVALGIPSDLIYDSGTTLQAASEDANILYAASGDQTINGSGGPDNDIFGSNFGNDVINNQNTNQEPDILWFATLDPSDITASRQGDNLILTDNTTGKQITVLNEFVGIKPTLLGGNLNPVTGVQQIVFADGTVWNFPDIDYQAGLNTKGVNGTLIGADGATVLDGNNGNTLLEGQSEGDIYLYDLGDGNDTINQSTADILVNSPDIVEFGADITPSDVTFTRNGDSQNLTVVFNNDSSDSLTVLNQFENTYTGVFGTVNLSQISDFVFADGTTYNNEQVEKLVLKAEEAIPYNTIYGFDDNDVIDPGVGGNDYMTGGNGNDTYIFGMGYGNDTIYRGLDNILSGGNDTVLFNADVDPADVSVVRNGGSNDFTLVLSDGSTLTILDQFENTWAGPFGNIQFNQIDNFQFQDTAGTDWNEETIKQMAIAAQLAVPGGAVYGFWDGAYIDPGTSGNHLMVGEGGVNTYVFGLGYGHDTILDSGGSEVLFNADVDPADVTFIRNDAADPNDLTILLSDGSELDLKDQFYYQPYGLGDVLSNQVSTFQFQDAADTKITNAELQQTLLSEEEQVPDSIIYSFYGGDTLSGAGGNETLVGVNGANTFLFDSGYGHEVIELKDDGYYWAERATGVVSFGAGITPDAVTLVTNSSTGELTVDFTGTTDTVTIENYSNLLANGRIGFQFADGTSWSAASITNIIETNALDNELGTPGSTLTGPFPDNFVDPGLDGDHDIVSPSGDVTYAFGLGYGYDTIQDGSGGGSEILFNSDVDPSSVTFSRGGANFFDLTVTLADGSFIDIRNELGYYSYGFGDTVNYDVTTFQFQDANDTSLTYAQVADELLAQEEAVPDSTIYGYYGGSTFNGASGNDSFVGVNGANTILYGVGDGQEYLSLYDDGYYYAERATANIVFGTGVTPESISIIPDGASGNLTVLLNDSQDDSLTIANYSSLLQSGYLSFQFADGTVWTSSKITAYLETATLNEELAVPGESLIGPYPYNFVDPGAGGGRVLNDEGYASTYAFGYGYGTDTIEDSSNGGSEILFNAGIMPSDVSFSRGGANYFDLTISLADGSSLVIPGEFGYHAYGFGESLNNDVGTFAFQGSSDVTFTYAEISQQILSSEESLTGSKVYGALGGGTYSGAGDNTFVGVNGASTFDFGQSDGQDYISLYDVGDYYAQRSSATVVFTGITANQITLYSDGSSGNITALITGTNDAISIDGGQSLADNGRLSFQFSDGTVWDGSSISTNLSVASSAITLTASVSDTNLVGINDGPNVFVLAPGGDQVTFGNAAYSGDNNVVEYGVGDGSVTIAANGGVGTIDFGAGISASDLTYTTNSSTAGLEISIADSSTLTGGDSIWLPGESIENSASFGVEKLVFADGTTLDVDKAGTPVINGGIPDQAVTDEASLNPFANVTISNPVVGATDGVTITLTGTSGGATDANGLLSGAGLTKTGTGVYSLSATSPASLTSELEALTFTPTAHQVGPGGTVTTDIKLVAGQGSLASANTITSIVATAVNDAPTISGAVAGQAMTDEGSLTPFSGVTISDPDYGVTDSLTITVASAAGLATDADGTLSGAGLTKTGVGLYSLAAVNPASLTSELEALTFTPTSHQVAPGSTVTTSFDLTASQGNAASVDATTSVIATAVNDAPGISGTSADQAMTDEATIDPFSGVTISDPDVGASDSLMITLTGTSGVATDADGMLSGSGLTKTGVGVYSLSAASPASLTTELQALTFTPTSHQVAPGSTVTTSFDLTASQGSAVSADTTTSVIATAVNDAPAISGAHAGQVTTDEASIDPFADVTISDPDIGASDSLVITLTGTSGVATDANGILSGTGLAKTGTGVYSLSAVSPASLTSELEALTFTPTAHQVAPGSTVTTSFKLTASQGSASSIDTATSVIATAVQDTLVVGGVNAGQSTTDESTLKPFSSVTIDDPDYGVTDSATITLSGTSGVATDADGTLSGSGLTKTGTGVYSLSAASPASLTSELEALTFTPTAHQVTPGSTVTTDMEISIVGQSSVTSANIATSVTATAVNDAPAISGAESGQTTTDEAATNPFSNVTITDPDLGASDSLTIILTGADGSATDANGLLTGTGLTKTGTGVYSLSATTPASLTSELEALTFTPTAHQVTPGDTVTTTFNLAASQGTATSTDTATSVIATAVDDPPTLGGYLTQGPANGAAYEPFSGLVVSDPDYGVIESLTIAITDASGTPTDANGVLSGTGLTEVSTGVYSLDPGSPASVTSELEALTFTPVAGSGSTTFGFSLSQGTEDSGGGGSGGTQGTIAFSGSNEILSIEGSVMPTDIITGFDTGGDTNDEIALTSFTYVSTDSVTLGANNVLSINLQGTSLSLDLDPTADYTGHTFLLEANSSNQVVIVDPVVSSSASDYASDSVAEQRRADKISVHNLEDLEVNGRWEAVASSGYPGVSRVTNSLVNFGHNTWLGDVVNQATSIAVNANTDIDGGVLKLIEAMGMWDLDGASFDPALSRQLTEMPVLNFASLAASHGTAGFG